MKPILQLAVAAAILALAAPAFAQQTQQQQDDQWAKETHDSVKDGMNTIGTTEDQAMSGNGASTTGSASNYVPDSNTVHNAAQTGANAFDSTTSAISDAIR